MIFLVLICMVLALCMTIAIFQFMRGFKRRELKKILLGLIMFLLTMGLLYFALLFILS